MGGHSESCLACVLDASKDNKASENVKVACGAVAQFRVFNMSTRAKCVSSFFVWCLLWSGIDVKSRRAMAQKVDVLLCCLSSFQVSVVYLHSSETSGNLRRRPHVRAQPLGPDRNVRKVEILSTLRKVDSIVLSCRRE